MTIRCFHVDDCMREWSSYRSGPPRTREELMAASHLILGHFSTTTFLDSILSHGLIPDYRKERVIDISVPSDAESVYLTAMYDRFYGKRAVEHHGGSPIVVEVIVSLDSLLADESAVSPAALAGSTPEQALFLGLCTSSQACKHKGPIPLSQILSISHIDGRQIYPAQP